MKKKSRVATAAGRIIEAFGGARPLSAELGIDPAAVYRWNYPKARRGSNGTIPSEWHAPILKAAKRRGIAIEKADLVNA